MAKFGFKVWENLVSKHSQFGFKNFIFEKNFQTVKKAHT